MTATPRLADDCTPRDVLETMVRIERRNLDWQRANDEPYAVITATLYRLWQLNERIAATIPNQPSAYQRNER